MDLFTKLILLVLIRHFRHLGSKLGGMGGILAREANVPPLKLMNPCLLAIEVVWDVSSLEILVCHLTGM